jgi:phytoene dehydrogenase-like protein
MTCNDHEHYEVLSLRPDQLFNFRLLHSDGLDHLLIDRIPISRLMLFGAT